MIKETKAVYARKHQIIQDIK